MLDKQMSKMHSRPCLQNPCTPLSLSKSGSVFNSAFTRPMIQSWCICRTPLFFSSITSKLFAHLLLAKPCINGRRIMTVMYIAMLSSRAMLFRVYHNHKVVSCPVAGCTDSYVELQEMRERKVVTMASETLPYAYHCKGTVHIKSPHHPL